MTEELVLRPIFEFEWDEAMKVVWDTFVLFDAPKYSREGIKNFKAFVKDPALKDLYLDGKYPTFVALLNGMIVGVISIRNKNHISLLFVDSDFQKKGIASRLILKAVEYVKSRENKNHITVFASPPAIGFYHKCGFVDTSDEITTDGITYTPMRLVF